MVHGWLSTHVLGFILFPLGLVVGKEMELPSIVILALSLKFIFNRSAFYCHSLLFRGEGILSSNLVLIVTVPVMLLSWPIVSV